MSTRRVLRSPDGLTSQRPLAKEPIADKPQLVCVRAGDAVRPGAGNRRRAGVWVGGSLRNRDGEAERQLEQEIGIGRAKVEDDCVRGIVDDDPM